MTHFKAIAAMAENRVIGLGARIPWHYSEELAWFKQMTIGQVVVMGRKTFESIGKALPDRETIVLSRTLTRLPGVRVVSGLAEINLAAESRDVYICGGAELYSQTLEVCSDLFLTHLKRAVEGDVYFPPFEHLFVRHEVLRETPDFRIVHYRRARF
jgi:dihydrofolate reductase